MSRIALGIALLLLPASFPGVAPGQATAPREVEPVLAALVESYGVSGMESPVRETVRRLLPGWARPEVDTAGNLWLSAGRGEPTVVLVAHLDEIGFRVDSIADDGRLAVTPRGGLFLSLWEGRPALVHTGTGMVPGVFAPREPSAPPAREPPALRVDVGTTTRAGTDSLGIRPEHTVTSPKDFARLAGTRVTGRSFDDRVGSAALVLALRRLDPARLRHRVIFLWSVREEIGLEGAAVAARALGLGAARVHAVDTFVSSDSPLEWPAFALAPLGRGPVARALDNSSVTSPAYVDSLVTLARARGIPLQVGATNGGNDGSAFAEFGVPDVPIGWPLRYAHSPAEVADLRDVAGLADLVRAIAEGW